MAFNLPGITELNLDAETIAKIFQGEIKSWDDPAIAKHNPGVNLPNLPVTPVNRSEDSGTTETFTEYLHAVVPDIWTAEPSDTWPAEFAGENAGDHRRCQHGGRDQRRRNLRRRFRRRSPAGQGQPQGRRRLCAGQRRSSRHGADQAKQVQGRPAHDLALELDRATTAAGAYPLMLVSYHIYCSTYEDQNKVDLVKAFGHYVLSPEGQTDAAKSAKSAPLSEELAQRAADSIDRISARS